MEPSMSKPNPSHPGESVRDSMKAMGWTVTESADRLGMSRNALSRLLNGRCGISPATALALERIGWSNAEFWMRRQAYYDLAQERRRALVPGG
jgi:addiction module HigA family antidote